MAFELKNLSIEEVSAVDEPANKHSRVVLLKRKGGIMDQDERAGLLKKLATYLGVDKADAPVNKEDNAMTEEVTKKIEELTSQVEALTKANAEAAEKVEALTKANAELTERTEKSDAEKSFRDQLPKGLQKAWDDMDEDERRKFMASYGKAQKSDDPVTKALSEVTKANDELVAKVARMEAEQELAKTREGFRDLDGLVNIDDLAKQYHAIAKVDKDAADAMVETTRKLAKQAKEGGLFHVIGKDGAGDESAEARLTKRVAKLREDNPELTEAAAMTKALEADPKLYDAYNAEKEAS